MKFHRHCIVTFVALCASIVAVGSAGTAGAAGASSIKGSLGVAGAGWKVLLVSPKGKATVTLADGSGSFSVPISRTTGKRSTLHLVEPNGQYFGPIVLAKEKVGAKWCVKTQLSGATTNLGTVTIKTADGYAAPSKWTAVKTAQFMRTGVLGNAKGRPMGAGRAGIGKMSAEQKKACAAAKVGAASVGAFDGEPSAADQPGADLDSDGLVNALDADDDGDTTIDAVDQTTKASAAMNPWVQVRTRNNAFNAAVTPTLSQTDINSVLGSLNGSQSNFTVVFFVENPLLVGSYEREAVKNSVSWAYVDCGTLVYCGGSTPTAYADRANNPTQLAANWNTYSGGLIVDRGSTADPAITSTGVNPDATKGNGLTAYIRNNNPQMGTSVFWVAQMFPNQGANTLANVKPGDVYTLRYGLTGGGESSVTMMLNPYALTVPSIKSINGAPYVSGTPVKAADGKVTIELYRPQRLAVDGEDGSFRDIAGLQYGLIVSQPNSNDAGCGGAAYSDAPGFDVTTSNDQGAMLTPIRDKATTDEIPGSSTLKFTVDLTKCAQASWSSLPATFGVSLMGAGEMLTGGYNRATLEGITISK
ncbi:MAG: hypothetical protein KJS66_10120 [Acidobacteria bacterium]|nr:hypothetical protein [Acidobacteriota bacterium]